MSDSEGDFSDELLELAGATEKRRRKKQSQGKPMKRRRTANDMSDSDTGDAASGDEGENENPYPLDGKYVDEYDREKLLDMPEVEREEILAQRQEELQRIQDKRNLDQMFRDRTGGGEESVSKAAKRQHSQRGATKEKSRKLDELKARRKAKGEKKRTRTDSPRRDRSSSPMDMEMSDEEEEDGQINKFDLDDERDRRSSDRFKSDNGPVTVEDLSKARLTRDIIARLWGRPYFEKVLQGAWVRYSCGYDKEHNTAVYRICEVVQLLPKVVKEYKLDGDRSADQEFLLRFADQEKAWPMDKVSNAPFTEKEFQKLKTALELAEMSLPTRRELEAKGAQIDSHKDLPLTEADLAIMLENKKKKEEHHGYSIATITLEKSRLHQARTLALRRKDAEEVAELDKKIALLNGRTSQTHSPAPPEKESSTQREQRAKIENLRKAEQAELERRRKERRERLLAADAEGTATPLLDGIKGSSIATPRQGTPVEKQNGQESSKVDFETSILDSVEIDLGDF